MISKTVDHAEAVGEEEMTWLAVEITNAKNSLIREHGFSPSQLLFGMVPKGYGEIVRNGEPCAYHFDVGVEGSQVARRTRLRHNARQAFVQAQASEMLSRTARNKTRPWKEPQLRDSCFFFRELRKKGVRGSIPTWLGPALVVGKQGSNLWLAFGGRCYLVFQEHAREAVGEEILFGRPEVQEALALFQKGNHKGEGKYIDLTGEPIPDDGSLDDLVGDDAVLDSDDEMANVVEPEVRPKARQPPSELLELGKTLGWMEDMAGNPVNSARHAYGFRTPEPGMDVAKWKYRTSWGFIGGSWYLLENDLPWQQLEDTNGLIPGGPAQVLITVFRGRTRKEICLDSVPECMKKQRTEQVFVTMQNKKAQRALDKEIPYRKISMEQLPEFQAAIDKEWKSWVSFDAATPLSLEESAQVIKSKPERVLRSRYVLRDKHAGLLTPEGNKMPLKAKARLCIQGQHDPDSASGLLKLDAPKIQHTSLMVFLHCVISFGWVSNWFSGDISSAFLQGKPTEGEPLFMYQPKQGISGLVQNQILRLNKPVYGRPDAPRAWYDALSEFIMSELHYERSLIDPALFIKDAPRVMP